MGYHETHTMHECSLATYKEEVAHLDARKRRILGLFKRSSGEPMSWRDVLGVINRLDGTDIQDPNHVRPRLTELKKQGFIRVADKKRDPVSGKMVSRFEYAGGKTQMRLF